jgi:hypothetical protein
VAGDDPVDLRSGHQPAPEDHAGDLFHVANTAQRIGIEQNQIGALAHFNDAL